MELEVAEVDAVAHEATRDGGPGGANKKDAATKTTMCQGSR